MSDIPTADHGPSAQGSGVPATLFERVDDEGVVRCTACAHRCRLQEGQSGICNVRQNVDGDLHLETYGKVYTSPFGPPGTPDPVEKKPLYHYRPGTRICSFGEPTIYAEYVRDSARKAHEEGLYTAIVTNGYCTPEFVDEVGPHLDAANVDIKGFRERPHIQVMGGKLEPTLEGTEHLLERDVHVELTYLTIPDLNDDPEEIREFAEWAYGLDPEIPVHFTQFHPADHEMRDRPRTSVETLETAHEIASDVGLEFVYVGNVPGHEYNSTYCPDCGRAWILREGFEARPQVDLTTPCACGREMPIVPDDSPPA